MGYLIGIDVGQRHEASGLCAVVEDERRRDHYLVKYLDRIPAGASFPEIASKLGTLVTTSRRQVGNGQVYVDATGLGQPIVDLIKTHSQQATVVPTYFTYGDRISREGRQITLGKAYLVARLQLLLQTHCIHLPKTPEADLLAQELKTYQIEVDEKANDRYGAFKVGSNDELVTALGMAVSGAARYRSAILSN